MLDFNKRNGLLPTICQDFETGEILMLAYVNQTAWEKTLETGEAHYWSTSRQELWHKGGTSGHVQKIKKILVDCDFDAIVYQVDQIGGAACHTGHRTCFHNLVENGGLKEIGEKVFDPQEVYKK